jgi:hypothetical protein
MKEGTGSKVERDVAIVNLLNRNARVKPEMNRPRRRRKQDATIPLDTLVMNY